MFVRLYVCQLTPCQAMAPHFDLHTHALNINVVQYHEYSWWPKSCTSLCSPRSPLDSMLTLVFSILGDRRKKSTLNKGEAGEWFALKSSPVRWCKILAINRCKKTWSAVLCMRWRRSARRAFNEKSHRARSPFTAFVSPENVLRDGM